MAYHYVESGLDNVWLESGVTIENHPDYGELVAIVNVKGLHEALGRAIATSSTELTGAEFRFLRRELELSQKDAARLIGSSEQTVSLWERNPNQPVGTAAAGTLMRMLYLEHLDGPPHIRELVEALADSHHQMAVLERHLSLEPATDEWRMAA